MAKNYANNTGNALTNPKGFMEETIKNINVNSPTPIKYNNGMIDMAVQNFEFETPNYGEERKLQPGSDPLSFADTIKLRTSLGGGAPVWKQFRLSEAQNIVVQNLSNGDDTEVNFGILNDGFGSGLGYPSSPENILVMVENVLQIPSTNYTLTQNPCDVSSNLIGAIGNYNSTGVGAYVSSNTGIVDFTSKGYHVGQTIVVSGAQTGGNNGTNINAKDISHI